MKTTSLRGDKRGAVLAEFAMAAFPLLLTFFSFAQVAKLYTANLVIRHAAMVGARAAIVTLNKDATNPGNNGPDTDVDNAVGLAMGSATLAPKGNPDATPSEFSIAELALRYRVTRSIELELSMGGGREAQQDGSQGDSAIQTGALGVRYHFRPEAAWN